ncbi:S66 peptidase family protein [Brumimicrobium aurantiacum]|uniref:LD-carboxypeptidase n=1 Tax=Brumimicrobium aurantiacum TaxID=1737063 RepID=A0A3E1F1W1_9FLAO|nr:LD-carboxypeptidase [Brumimicrobium aurantiacum]RFC55804.1 LD-carboxypeptidase [Brumimicrobium aurantiacum]
MLPHNLKKGDTVAIVAPAKGIEKHFVDYAKQCIEERGFKVLTSENCLGQHHYFSGTVKERADDLQWAINNDEVTAILCARGGYGCVQLLDRINWAGFIDEPKWLLGFSDVTVFHQHLAKIGAPSIHSTMPLNFESNTKEALDSLFKSLDGSKLHYSWTSETSNIPGSVGGEVIGGNLTVLTGLIGTKHQPDFQNKLLFIEDVGEHLYAIDRQFHQLSKAGILDQIRGLIVGDFSGIKDTNPPFGSSLTEIIKSHFAYNSIPICFDFPAGHTEDNRALIFGKHANLKVENNTAELIYD